MGWLSPQGHQCIRLETSPRGAAGGQPLRHTLMAQILRNPSLGLIQIPVTNMSLILPTTLFPGPAHGRHPPLAPFSHLRLPGRQRTTIPPWKAVAGRRSPPSRVTIKWTWELGAWHPPRTHIGATVQSVPARPCLLFRADGRGHVGSFLSHRPP